MEVGKYYRRGLYNPPNPLMLCIRETEQGYMMSRPVEGYGISMVEYEKAENSGGRGMAWELPRGLALLYREVTDEKEIERHSYLKDVE